jgi:hypothetical protein
MMPGSRKPRIPLLILAALLLLGSMDLCGHGPGERGNLAGAPESEETAAATSLTALACGDACHDSAPEDGHADHCAGCSCLCHVNGILPHSPLSFDGAAQGVPIAGLALQRVSTFHSEIEHPPLFS